MPRLRRLLHRLLALVRRDRAERELDREVAAHLALLEDGFRAKGMDADAARRAARLALGGVDQTKERHRDTRSLPWLEDLHRDLRYAVRQLWRDRGAAAVGIGSLAAGIAAAAIVAGTIDGVLLNPYPYPGVERTVAMRWTDRSGRLSPMPMNPDGFQDMLSATGVDDGVLWEVYSTATRDEARVHSILAGWVSPNAFRFFGVRTAIGRTFDGDVAHLADPTELPVVLSTAYWRQRYGSDPAVLGRTLRLDGAAYTIVGVIAGNVSLLNADVYIPLPPRAGPFMSFVKLKPGVTRAAAAAELSGIFQRRAGRNGVPNASDLRVVVTDLRDYTTGHLTGILAALAAAVGVLLAIGCANLSILLTSRGIARRQELEMRKALGASTSRLVRQLLTESLLSALIACVLGVGLAWLALPSVAAWSSVQAIPANVTIALNTRVLAVALAAALAAGVLAGTWPSLRLARQDRTPVSRGTVDPAGVHRLHSLHVFAQVALTMVLLAAAASALRAFVALTSASLGYDPSNTTVLTLQLARGALPGWGERTAYYERLREAVATLPGVETAALALDTLPPITSGRSGLIVEGRNVTTTGNIAMERVSHDYFAVLRLPLRQGRLWTAADDAEAGHVAVVNEAFVRTFFPDADPIGRRVELGGLDRRSPYSLASPNYDKSVEIIGIVGDARNAGLRDTVMPAVFVPHTLLTWDVVRLAVRTAGAAGPTAAAVQQRIAEVNPDQPADGVTTLAARLRLAGWARQELTASLFLACAVIALLLAAVGIYSVVACAVVERRRELAVRMALGGPRARVVGAVLSRTLIVVALGVVAGIVAIAALDVPLARWTDARLWDAASVIPIVAALALVVLGAVTVPARRAVSTDPMTVLRME